MIDLLSPLKLPSLGLHAFWSPRGYVGVDGGVYLPRPFGAPRDTTLALTSSKSNIGHLEGSVGSPVCLRFAELRLVDPTICFSQAGIAGFLKCVESSVKSSVADRKWSVADRPWVQHLRQLQSAVVFRVFFLLGVDADGRNMPAECSLLSARTPKSVDSSNG